jgi:hypothetical protein
MIRKPPLVMTKPLVYGRDPVWGDGRLSRSDMVTRGRTVVTWSAPPGARSAPAKVGVIGTGFIGTGLFYAIERRPDLRYQAGLTRRGPGSVPGIDQDRWPIRCSG